jgi:hypothetical protein
MPAYDAPGGDRQVVYVAAWQGEAALARDGREQAVQLVLTVVAALGRVIDVAGPVHLLRLDQLMRDADRPG